MKQDVSCAKAPTNKCHVCGAIKPDTTAGIASFILDYLAPDIYECPQCQISRIRQEAIKKGMSPKVARELVINKPFRDRPRTYLEELGLVGHHTHNLR